jgi:peptide/nickel transport system substrate-binding protein
MKTRTLLVTVLTALLVGAMLLTACGAAPEPEVIEKVVEKVVTQVVQETVKETVIVEGTPEVVEKEVTKVVEEVVEVVVTATPAAEEEAAPQNPFTPDEDIVIVAHNQDGFETVDLRTGYPDASAYFVQLQILEKLIFQDDQLELRGQLAESWEANEDSTAYTFKLKEGVVFHDGDPLNAEAVKKHFDFFLADPPSAVAATLRADIDNVEVVDEYTVRFNLQGPRPFFLYNLAESPGSLIYSPQTVALPDEDRLRDVRGTGPFRIKEWLGQRDLLLEANPDYNWASDYFENQGPPKIQTLRILNAADTDARLVALETGEVHFITLVPDAHVARLKQDPNYRIVSKLVPGMPQMNYLNVTIPPTNDLRVRQAINYAVNKDEINQVVYFGNVEPAYGPLSKANLEYNPEVEGMYPYDLEKAKALLEEAGWWDEDGDGIAEAHGVEGVEDGTMLEARIVRGRSWQQYSDVLQRQLSMAGFKSSIIMMAGQGPDWYACLNQVPANGDVFIDSVVGMTRDWDKDQCFTGAMNYGCGCDTPEIQEPIQEYLAAASAAQTMDERKEALGGLQKFIMEQALEVPIYELYWHAGTISSLEGIKTDGTGFYYFFYDANWTR